MTPEIQLALDVNAPGSLIPTEQLRALVDGYQALEKVIGHHEDQIHALQSRLTDCRAEPTYVLCPLCHGSRRDCPKCDGTGYVCPADEINRLTRLVAEGEEALLDRVCAYLRERAAWFDYEAKHGGDWKHLKIREEECLWIEQAIRNGRYKEDGRPAFLVNAITVPAAPQKSARG